MQAVSKILESTLKGVKCMPDELKKAIEDLRHKDHCADPIFEEVAYHELKAAEARVDALIKEKRG